MAPWFCPKIYGAPARKRPVDFRKARRFMSFLAEVDGDETAVGSAAIGDSVGEHRGPSSIDR